MPGSERGAAQKRYMGSDRDVVNSLLTLGVNGPVKKGEGISLSFLPGTVGLFKIWRKSV